MVVLFVEQTEVTTHKLFIRVPCQTLSGDGHLLVIVRAYPPPFYFPSDKVS